MITSKSFGQAFCEHFGLDSSKVMESIHINTEADSIFSATLEIALTAEDLEGIADRMKGLAINSAMPNKAEIKALISDSLRKNNEWLIDALRRGGVS